MSDTEVKRVSLEELKEIANRVRKAGGGNPIDALMPAVPEESTTCLIAKNLNFNCRVGGPNTTEVNTYGLDPETWVMRVEEKETAEAISKEMGWPMHALVALSSYYPSHAEDKEPGWFLVLPPEVGQVAADFDTAGDLLSSFIGELADADDAGVSPSVECIRDTLSCLHTEQLKLVREMAPYIEAAKNEAYDLATIIHPDGSISI